MRKVVFAIISFLVVFSQTGFTTNIHLCRGKIVSNKFIEAVKKPTCSKCKKASSPCCKLHKQFTKNFNEVGKNDERTVAKIFVADNDYKLSNSLHCFLLNSFDWNSVPILEISSRTNKFPPHYFLNHFRYVFLCVFRL